MGEHDWQVLQATYKSESKMHVKFALDGTSHSLKISAAVDAGALLLASLPSKLSQILLRKKVLNLLCTSVDRKLGHVWRGPFSFDPTRHKPLRCVRPAPPRRSTHRAPCYIILDKTIHVSSTLLAQDSALGASSKHQDFTQGCCKHVRDTHQRRAQVYRPGGRIRLQGMRRRCMCMRPLFVGWRPAQSSPTKLRALTSIPRSPSGS